MNDTVVADCGHAISQYQQAKSGPGQQIWYGRVLKVSTELSAERDRLFVKLNAQWHWLMEQCPDDRDCDPDEVFLKREQIYLRTLESYVQVNDALSAAKAVL